MAVLAPTQIFGRYQIIKQLGEGGMGTVYLANDLKLPRQVAIKVPQIDANSPPEFLERFNREGRVVARIHHPNICAVLDVGDVDGTPYLAMFYIAGTPLSKMVQRESPWSPQRTAHLIHKLALALQVLHDEDLIHRDIKPGNIIVQPSGEPVIVDFGLARSVSDPLQSLTNAGIPMGTPGYMAPEQVEGNRDRQGPATDIYGLGMVLYELLTGTLPFQGSLGSVFGQILYGDVPKPSTVRPELPPVADTICLKALAKQPDQRYRSMTEFASDLLELIPRYEAPSSPRSTWGWWIGASSLVILVLVGLLFLPRKLPTPQIEVTSQPETLMVSQGKTARLLLRLRYQAIEDPPQVSWEQEELPAGVTIQEEDRELRADSGEISLRVSATQNTPPGILSLKGKIACANASADLNLKLAILFHPRGSQGSREAVPDAAGTLYHRTLTFLLPGKVPITFVVVPQQPVQDWRLPPGTLPRPEPTFYITRDKVTLAQFRAALQAPEMRQGLMEQGAKNLLLVHQRWTMVTLAAGVLGAGGLPGRLDTYPVAALIGTGHGNPWERKPSTHQGSPPVPPRDPLRYPVTCITVTEAHYFADFLGGHLPTVAQWDTAAGRYRKDRPPQGPFWGIWNLEKQPTWNAGVLSSLATPGYGSLASALGSMGICANKEVVPSQLSPMDRPGVGVSPYGCRDMAGNGLEWTRTLRGGRHVPLENLQGDPYVLLRGTRFDRDGFDQVEPLFYRDLDQFDRDGFHTKMPSIKYIANEFVDPGYLADVSFRVVLVPGSVPMPR